MAAFNEYSERFLGVIEKLGFSDYKVWNEVESLSKATMSKIRRGLCGVSMNTLCDFVEKYPEVNADYIITGRGSMYINSSTIADAEEAANDEIIKLHRELEDAYIQLNAAHAEIGRLSMELKSAQQHNLSKKIG